MKQKFSTLDVRAMVASIRADILGSRVVNIYDMSSKFFLIKLLSFNPVTENSKEFLLIEAGTRFHLTKFLRQKTSALPGGWTMGLRKLLKNKKIEDVQQVGADRVVIIQFGVGDKANKMIIELYSKGNIIITDHEDRILLLLRDHSFDDKHSTAKSEIYPLAQAASVTSLISSTWRTDVADMVSSHLADTARTKTPKKAIQSISEILQKVCKYANPGLCYLAVTKYYPNTDILDLLDACITYCDEVYSAAGTAPVRGYTTATDFAPLPSLIADGARESASFSDAVDDYFSGLEIVKQQKQVETQREALKVKVVKIREDQYRRIAGLEEEQASLWSNAEVLQRNVGAADKCFVKIWKLIALQLEWFEINDAIKLESDCACVRKLDLGRNRVQLGFPGDDEEHCFWLDLDLTAQGNVEVMHEQRKAQKVKLEKTREQSEKAIKVAERKSTQEISRFEDKVNQAKNLTKIKRKLWFEKFHWFISSENFLVLAGRDAAQNELLVKKYLKARDIYVHADVHGAATVIVKNHLPAPLNVTFATLAEAGQFSLCLSKAWESKTVTSAWYVFADQVSKSAPTGEYLTTGSFIIRGRKNFLPHSKLEMTFALLFQSASGTMGATERPVKSDSVVCNEEERRLFDELINHQPKPNPPKPQQQKTPALPQPESVEESKPLSRRTEARKSRKMKKAQERYGEQDSDDSELELKLRLIGAKTPAPVVHASQPAIPAPLPQPQEKKCFHCGEPGHLATNCPQRPADLPGSSDSSDDEEEDVNELAVVSRLSGAPPSELVRIVPVCGPLSALGSCQFRLKLTPGNLKRGPAAQLCLKLIAASNGLTDSVKQMIKQIQLDEATDVLIAGVKVSAPGAQKVQVELKAQKKKVARAKRKEA